MRLPVVCNVVAKKGSSCVLMPLRTSAAYGRYVTRDNNNENVQEKKHLYL